MRSGIRGKRQGSRVRGGAHDQGVVLMSER